MTNSLARWMAKATPVSRERLAHLADTTLGTLRQIAGSYRTKGRPRVTPELAARIERAVKTIGGPKVLREELCPACAACEFAKRCRKT